MNNLITDVPGLRVGAAQDARLASGVSVVVFDEPATAGLAIPGGAPALRDGALLAPEMTVERVDAFVLSGGSAFGLDAAGGAMACLAEHGRGFAVGAARVPIVPGAALFDLNNGGDKAWGRRPPYCDLGFAAAANAGADFALGTRRRRLRRDDLRSQGRARLGERGSPRGGFLVGALAAVNAAGRATRGAWPHFWAAALRARRRIRRPRRWRAADDAFDFALKTRRTRQHHARRRRHRRARSTRRRRRGSRSWRTAGFALALRPAHAPSDGDVVFAAATARAAPRARPARSRRDRHARRRMPRARDRPRRLRGDAAAVRRRAAELEGAVWAVGSGQ